MTRAQLAAVHSRPALLPEAGHVQQPPPPWARSCPRLCCRPLDAAALQRRAGPSLPAGAAARGLSLRCAAAAAALPGEAGDPWVEDRSLRVRVMLAESSGKLDLSECNLTYIPPDIFDLTGLEELSLAGNRLRELPPAIGRLTSLQRLQLAGNELRELPEELGALASLSGLWLHGNRLERCPDSLGALTALTQLSLAGNRLASLPDSLGGLAALQDLGLAGNRLRQLPGTLGALSSLVKLSLHGNRLAFVPASFSGLASLRELWLQGNPPLTALPPELGACPALEQLSAADCGLCSLPAELGQAPALKALTLYGNPDLTHIPVDILKAPSLRYVWAEGTPLTSGALTALLEALPGVPTLSALGLDRSQLERAPAAAVTAAGARLAACDIEGEGPGYFKLERAAGGAASDVLVVSFGSAPGVPNWGGLLKRVRGAATCPEEARFDALYVVDPARSWYGGGDEGAFRQYESRLAAATSRYSEVVFVGDSMGATAALLLAPLATAVHAFCPQVDLASSSIRPGQGGAWFEGLKGRVLAGVAACRERTSVYVHVGKWGHDIEQVRLLPPGSGVTTRVYSVDSHRLALALDRQGRLLPLVRGEVLRCLGLEDQGQMRLVNLV